MSTEAPAAPLLEVRQLSAGYGDLRVVWDVSFDARAGEITVLLGRNGAGKTTTLRAIAGLNRIAGGDVLFEEQPITRLAPHRRVRQGMAYVQEGKRVFRTQSVEQNLLLGGYSRSVKRRALRIELAEIYDMFPILGDKRAQLASSLSGGQQQMLAIGQALMSRPKLLLLDEPSGGLAPVVLKEVMSQVQQLKSTGLGIIVVEQAVQASFDIADNVAVLDMGRTVMSERAAAVSDISVLHDAYFGRSQSVG